MSYFGMPPDSLFAVRLSLTESCTGSGFADCFGSASCGTLLGWFSAATSSAWLGVTGWCTGLTIKFLYRAQCTHRQFDQELEPDLCWTRPATTGPTLKSSVII